MKRHIELLGRTVKEIVTGFTGVVTSINFDLYGCVQALVQPPQGKDGKIPDREWFDVKRLRVTGGRVMALPDFGLPEAGGQALPPQRDGPR